MRGAGCALVVAVLTLMPGVAAARPDRRDPGRTTSGATVSNGTEYRYVLYTPTSYRRGRSAPLLVMVHGCQTTAEQQMKANLYNRLAERERFVVLYPDVDAVGRAQPGPANQCWRFSYPPAWTRGRSDAAAIADMTRAVMAKRAIDRERVYLMGMSAGGLMASVEAAAYPDLFAAVGISAASAYADWTCLATGAGIPVTTSARLAFDQMGPRARIVPRFVIGGDADQAFPPACTAKALEQGLRTNNLVIGDRQRRPIPLTPAAVRHGRKPGGYAYTVASYRDPAGCLVGERWLVHGMEHFWSGGTTDPAYENFTDPKGPSGAKASWAFFERYRRSDTAMPCAEAPVAFHPPRCLPRRLHVGGGRIGPARLGRRLSSLTNRYRPVRRTHSSARFCVRGGGRFVVGLRGGRIDVVASNARGHRTRATGPGRRLRPGSRRLTRALRVGRRSGGGRVLYGIRRGRVRFLAVVAERQVRRPRALTRRLRRFGFAAGVPPTYVASARSPRSSRVRRKPSDRLAPSRS